MQAGSFDPGEQVVELVLGVLALVWLWPGGMPPLGLDKMHASSPDPGVQVIELPLVDGVVEVWPCPGATPPPPNGDEGDGLLVEPQLPDGGAEPGGLSPPGGTVVPGV